MVKQQQPVDIKRIVDTNMEIQLLDQMSHDALCEFCGTGTAGRNDALLNYFCILTITEIRDTLDDRRWP